MNLFGRIINKFIPIRLNPDDYCTVADLDAFIKNKIAFQFGGRLYEILPVSTEEFIKFSHSLDKINKLLKMRSEGVTVSDEQIICAYYSFFNPLCPKLSLRDVGKMTVPQLHALLQLFLRHLTGQDLAEKKKLMIQPVPLQKMKEPA